MGFFNKIIGGARQFHNQTELKSALLNDLLDPVMERVMERLIDVLVEFAQTDVYSAFSPKWYDRTMSLADRDMWSYEKPRIDADCVRSCIGEMDNSAFSFAEQGLPVDEEKWQHGNKYYGELSPKDFVAIINEGSHGGMANFPPVPARPFWDDFDRYVQNHIDEIFVEECRNSGINLY